MRFDINKSIAHTRASKIGLAFAILTLVSILATFVYTRNREVFSDANSKTTVEYFYMNGCSWCSKFMPEWEKFEAVAPTVGVKATKTEASENPEKVSALGIKGFPTVIITKDGKSNEYNGARTSKALLEHVS